MRTLAVSASIALVLTGSSLAGDETPLRVQGPAFAEGRAWRDLKAQVAFGPRVPGTPAHRKTRDWLVEQLSKAGAKVTLQPFSHVLRKRSVEMWNILAEIPGTGAGPTEQVLLAAHWDTRPTADKDPDIENRKLPIDGANDGASGVAVLLEIARQLKASPISRDVVIALFDGEDYGPSSADMYLGSKYYANNLPAKKPDWGILLDMVGDKKLTIYREPNSERYAKVVNDRIFRAARELCYIRTGHGSGFVNSLYSIALDDDHIPLNNAGIPTADLIDFDYPAWHTLGDTVDACSSESLKIVGRVVLQALRSE